QLLKLQGMGEQKLREYGPAILQLVREHLHSHPAPQPTPAPDPTLVEALKKWRLQQAKAQGVQAFRIFGNKTLDAIAAAKPRTRDELLNVPGIGPAKLEAYGDGILEITRA